MGFCNPYYSDWDIYSVIFNPNNFSFSWISVSISESDLIFSDSFSTKDLINEISGRGYGLSAVKSEIMKLKGTIQVDTSVGRGTKFIFTFLNND